MRLTVHHRLALATNASWMSCARHMVSVLYIYRSKRHSVMYSLTFSTMTAWLREHGC